MQDYIIRFIYIIYILNSKHIIRRIKVMQDDLAFSIKYSKY